MISPPCPPWIPMVRLGLFLTLGILVPAGISDAQSPVSSKPASATPTIDPFAVTGTERTYPEIDSAIALYGSGDTRGTARDLRSAVKAHPELDSAEVLYSRILLQAGEINEAVKLLEQVAFRFPEEPSIFAMLGQLRLDQGRQVDALLCLEQARRLAESPDFAATRQDRILNRCLSMEAELYEQRREWTEVMDLLQELLSRQPDEVSARNRLARALMAQDREAEAMAELKRASQLNPNQDPPEIRLAWICHELNRFDEAERRMRKSVREYPRDPMRRIALGRWLLARERHREAVPQFEEAIARTEEPYRPQLLLALAKYRIGKYEQAEEMLEPLLAEQPTNRDVLELMALTLAEQFDIEKKTRALEITRALVEAQPENPEFQATLGWVLLENGSAEEAIQVLQPLLQPGTTNPNIVFYYTTALEQIGQFQNAETMIREALNAPIGQFSRRSDARELLFRLRLR